MSRACIPFHILFDKDLSKNELLIYALIEHMESDGKAVFFNNRTIAEKLGVSHESRIVGKMLQKLKDKGYIHREHKEVSLRDRKGNVKKVMRWCLNTVKSTIVSNEPEDENMVPEVPPITMVPEVPQNMVPEVPPYNTPLPTSPLTTTPGGGSVLNSFEKECLSLKIESDTRAPEEFIQNINHHLENNSPKDKPVLMRQKMLLSLLKQVKDNGSIFESVGFVSQVIKQETKRKQQQHKEHLLWGHYQNYLKSPVEIDLRTRGIAQEMTFEQWKTKNA